MPICLPRYGFSLVLSLLMTVPALAAGVVTGTVTNKTTGKPDAGDTVALIAFGQGMQVATQTKTDAKGRYQLTVPDDSMHLVRVDHQKAAYFAPAPPGTKIANVDVYDVAASVKGVTTVADVLALDTTPGNSLHVTEDFFVRNDSKPALTQFSNHAYGFYLPPGAKLEAAAAMGPAGMPVDATPVPQPGDSHYAFVFPVRPGQSRFQVSYSLAYTSSFTLTKIEELATDNLIVMLPKSMRFEPKGTGWQPVPENMDAQIFVRKGIAPAVPVQFTVAGTGALPRDARNDEANNQAGGQSTAEGRPGGGLGPPIDTPDPLHRYKGWLLGALGLVLLGAAWLLSRRPRERAVQPASDPFEPEAEPLQPTTGRGLRSALEAALLALERDHAEGRILEPELSESRAALQRTLHRVLVREAAAPGTSPGSPLPPERS